MMASLKAPSTALQYFFSHSTYYMYAFVPEKTLRLVYGAFDLAIFCKMTTLFLKSVK